MWRHLLAGLHDLCNECQLIQITRCFVIQLAGCVKIMWLFDPREAVDKMAVISQTVCSDEKFGILNEKFGILIKISLKFVPKGPFDNNPTWV